MSFADGNQYVSVSHLCSIIDHHRTLKTPFNAVKLGGDYIQDMIGSNTPLAASNCRDNAKCERKLPWCFFMLTLS